MKRILCFSLLVVFFLPMLSSAQNYRNICPQGITFFKDKVNNLAAFRRDSIHLQGLNDTVFLSYYAIRDSLSSYCLDTSNGSVLGRRILITHDGWICFFNLHKDTIRIKSNAVFNETWQMAKLPDSGHLDATMTGTIVENVIGIDDSVKIFSLQARNAANMNIPHPMNQFTITLSKHFGLTRIPDFYYLPDETSLSVDTISWTLAGRSTPVMGLQEFGWKEIYAFDIGDVFHYKGLFPNYFGNGYDWNKIMTVLEKTEYGNDSVRYTFEMCTDTTFMPGYNHNGMFDTLSVVYRYNQPAEPEFISALPLELVPRDEVTDKYYRKLKYGSTYLRQMKGRNGNYSGNDVGIGGNSNCWGISVGWDDILEYSEGLGLTLYHNGNMAYYKREWLVYYKKGDETWGTPVSTSCITLGIPQEMHEPGTLKLAPNPAVNSTDITVPSFERSDNYTITLSGMAGNILRTLKMTSNPFPIDCGALSEGVYIVVVSDVNGRIKYRGKLVVMK